MLVYAVDRPVARTLCDRHLGAPPGDLAPPPWTRARQGLKSVAGGRMAVAFVGVALLVLAAALGAIGWVPAGTAPVEDDPAEAATDPGSDVPQIGSTPVATADYGTPATGDSGTTPAGDSEASTLADDELPPGVTEAGIADLDTLAAAHDHVASNRSHTLYLDRYPLRAAPNGSRVQRDVTVTAAGGEYLITMDTVDSPTRHLGAVYHDGRNVYGAYRNRSEGAYGRVVGLEPDHSRAPAPAVGTVAVERYLSTSRSALIGRTTGEGRPVYRIVGSGRPAAPEFRDVNAYTVTALVDDRGFVRTITIEYAVRSENSIQEIRREMVYERVGATTVQAPA